MESSLLQEGKGDRKSLKWSDAGSDLFLWEISGGTGQAVALHDESGVERGSNMLGS